MPKVALCLSGGGARAILQAGMLKAWIDLGFKEDFVYGVSAGALNAQLYIQKDYDLIEKTWLAVKNTDIYKNHLLPYNVLSTSVYDSTPLKKFLGRYVNVAKVKANPTPLYVNATDIRTGDPIVKKAQDFEQKELVTFLTGSASPPILFENVAFEGTFLCDGGLSDDTGLYAAVTLGADVIVLLQPTPRTDNCNPHNILDQVNLMSKIYTDNMEDKELGFIQKINTLADEHHPELRQIKLVVVRPDPSMLLPFLDFEYRGYNRQDLLDYGYTLAKEILLHSLA